MIPYELPTNWIRYDSSAIATALVEAKTAILSLKQIPYQRQWVEALQQIELKREVAGTSRIEGAEFTEREFEAALSESAHELFTRSQRQAQAAVRTYRWIAAIPPDKPIDAPLILDIHRRIVQGADDDHCAPGELRGPDQNVTFGQPRHRGAEGGDECRSAFQDFVAAIGRDYRAHDPLVQAFAAHYHLAAMHPFLDGNGRTARALEALMLQRAGLRDSSFIAMSNYYYDEKTGYLQSLAAARLGGDDLTPFLRFALKGAAIQSQRLLTEIQHQIQNSLFHTLALDLFSRLKSPRRRVIAQRQLHLLRILLQADSISFTDLRERTSSEYKSLKAPTKALVRDLNDLLGLGAIEAAGQQDHYNFSVRLDWPTEITESTFFDRLKKLPHAKSLSFIAPG